MSDNKEMIWSFSRLTPHCLYSWKQTYLDNDRGDGNCFSQYGLIGHEILEQYHNEDLFGFELAEEFTKQFNQMEYDFPPNKYCDLRDRYYQAGLNFFTNGVELFFKEYELLEVEQERTWEIDGHKFVGFPDYVGRHKETCKIHIVDYKSAAPYKADERKKKIMQLYLYSIPIKEIYGEYPEYLVFLHYRHDKPVRIKFKLDELEKTKDWSVKQIEYLYSLSEYPANNESSFFCNYICGHRGNCPFKD